MELRKIHMYGARGIRIDRHGLVIRTPNWVFTIGAFRSECRRLRGL